MTIGQKLTFQEIWQAQIGPLRLVDATRGRQGLIGLARDGRVTLVDYDGTILWTVANDEPIRSISMAETREVLLVSESGHAILIDDQGQTLWKKRGVPALFGLISSGGQALVFVTREPAVVMTDRFLRQRWAFRNLIKTPRALAVSHDGETTAFACTNDLGEGLAAISRTGKPYDSFMGLDPVQDLMLSSDGKTLVAFDQGKAIFCLNCVDSFGIWRGAMAQDFAGVSYADAAKQTLLFSTDGLLVILDENGQPIWEHRFSFPLLRAFLSSDGQAIRYASPDGRVGCLESRSGRDLSRLEFIDIEAPQVAAEKQCQFRRLWDVELPTPAPGDAPRLMSWANDGGVESHLLWNGRDQLLCLDESGGEIWNNRFPNLGVEGMGISPAADLIMLTTSRGVLGLTLEGKEVFKFFGHFRGVHVFANGAFLLQDPGGVLRYYRSASHFVRILNVPGKVLGLHGGDGMAFLVGAAFVARITADGDQLPDIATGGEVTCHADGPSDDLLMLGTKQGEVCILAADGAERYRRKSPDGEVAVVAWNPGADVVFSVVHGSTEVVVMQLRANQRSRVKLTGDVTLSSFHRAGALVGTSIDELVLIGCQGEILARRTCSDRLLAMRGRPSGDRCVLLTAGSLSCLTTGEDTIGPGHLQFLEL